MKIVVFDPAVENVNAGDEIISQSVERIEGLGRGDVERLTTHRFLTRQERKLVSSADLVVLGGTNALSSRMERFRQWWIDPDLALRMRQKLVLLGVGWWQYQDAPNAYSRTLFRQILKKDATHALRDEYTRSRIAALGLPAMNTSCPTTWNLDYSKVGLFGSAKAVVTVTDYKKNAESDRQWLKEVKDNYDEVVAVGMGPGDDDYFHSLELSGINWAGNGVQCLESQVMGADFIGTRLHAGVRALQLGSPSIILSVDNRAAEMAKTSNFFVAERSNPMVEIRNRSEMIYSAQSSSRPKAADVWLEQFTKMLSD